MKILYTTLVAHLHQFKVITESHHGFLSRKSTTTNFLDCLNDWTLSSMKIDMFTDLEKAFDLLTYEKLLFMLSKLGIRVKIPTCFSNFLTGCFFYAKVGTVTFEYRKSSIKNTPI